MIIHILKYGSSLCNISNEYGTPNNWPAGHYWVSEEYLKKVTCKECLKSYKKK